MASFHGNEGQHPKEVAMVWDPKNPSALLLPVGGQPVPLEGDKIAAMKINTILSHTGVGCNEHEIAALMTLLDSFESHSKMKRSVKKSWNNIKTLSKAYRSALRECLCRWEDNLEELKDAMAEDSDPNLPPDLSKENLELLKIVYAVLHLTEIFLLPPPAEEIAMDYYDDFFVIPGALTADTVRYLRYHHTTDALQQVDPEVLQDLQNSLHPDQVDGGEPYWNLVYRLVRRGNLEGAWAFLSRHSACRRAFEATSQDDALSTIDDYEVATLEQDKDGFLDLRKVLLSAPLPGGRDDYEDVGLDGPDLKVQYSETLLEGIEPNAYRMWETSGMTMEGSDFPVSYNPRAATMKRNHWQQYVQEFESVRRLKRRIPQLDGVLAILSGSIQGVRFESWAEALIAELIYVNPSIQPCNIQIRVEKLIEKYPPTHSREIDPILLNIMQGNAGQALEVLNHLGGGSGAALPATVTSLLCNLYVDFHVPMLENLQMDLLKNAAFGISSSLAAKNSDTAVQLVVRLLTPYCKPRGDSSIVATLGSTLERHTAGSDVEVKNVIALCQRLVEKKSILALEGCVSLVLSRYRNYLREKRPGGAMHWLLVGMELEGSLYAVEKGGTNYNWQKIVALSVCHRHIVMWSNRISGALLSGMLDETEGLGLYYATAKEMVESVKEGPMEGYAGKMSEVRTLEYVLGIYDGLTESADWTSAARNITKCLQEEPDELDGVVDSVAPPSMRWGLLQLGYRIVDADEQRKAVAPAGDFTPFFDVKGVQVLLEQMTIIPLALELEKVGPLPAELVKKMRLSLAKALMWAFVAENAKRKALYEEEEDEETMIRKIRSVDIFKYDLRTQERVVQAMLDI